MLACTAKRHHGNTCWLVDAFKVYEVFLDTFTGLEIMLSPVAESSETKSYVFTAWENLAVTV